MDWIDIEVQDSSQMHCVKCKQIIVDLNNVYAYGEWMSDQQGRKQYLFFQEKHVPLEKITLSQPYLVNEEVHFLMYLQTIQCYACGTEIGIYFRTANRDNVFALKKYAFDLKKIRFKEKNQEIVIEVFAQALYKSKESMGRKKCPQQEQQQSKQRKVDVGTTIREIAQAYKFLLQAGQDLTEQLSRQRQKHIEQSCRK